VRSRHGVNNILMIVSDTVRWDMLGYNGGPVRTPNLDKLAARSMIFERHYASSFPTVPARYDYLTGKPAYAGPGWGPLPKTDRSVVLDLRDAGYTTVGVVDTPFYQVNGYEYDRGFHYFYDLKSQLLGTPQYNAFKAPEATKRQASGKLPQWPITRKVAPDPRVCEADCPTPLTMAQAEMCLEYVYQDRFFALVDTWDPHEPWDPPEYYTRRYLPDYAGERVHPPYGDYRAAGLTDRDLEVARALYSGELELVDRWIGRLIEKLDYLGISDSTAILFCSDHGFFLGEHGLLGKMVRRAAGEATWMRSPLYEELARVPLLVSMPGMSPGRSTALTCALDVAPTLLDLAGVSPRDDMPGRSVMPAVAGEAFDGHDHVLTALPFANPGEHVGVVDDLMRTVVEWQPVTLTTDEWSLLYATPSESIELYNLHDDPRQQVNLADDRPDVVRALLDHYAADLVRDGVDHAYREPRLGDAVSAPSSAART
jgi:arylsulfatase A-like enzyme